MSGRELQEKFVSYLQLAYPLAEVKERPDSTVIFYFINKAVKKLIDSIYKGENRTGLGAEGNSYNTEVLRGLISYHSEVPTSGTDNPNSFIASLPSDYMYPLSEEVSISAQDLNNQTVTSRQGVTESNSNTYSQQLKNPYSEHVLHYEKAEPLRLFSTDTVELITDGNYTITNYYLRYYKTPTEIGVDTAESAIELPSSTHEDVVELALSLYLRNIGGSRYSEQSEQNNNN